MPTPAVTAADKALTTSVLGRLLKFTTDDETAGEWSEHLTHMSEEQRRISNERDDKLSEAGVYIRIHRGTERGRDGTRTDNGARGGAHVAAC